MALNLEKLIRSKEYADARVRVRVWRGRLEKGGATEARRVRDEKSAFFAMLEKSSPQVYEAFRTEDKSLSEEIFKKLTGKDVVLG